MRAGFNQLSPHLQRINKARARGGKVEAPRFGRADLVLHQTCGCWEEHVRRYRSNYDRVDLRRRDPRVPQTAAGSLRGEIASGYPFLGNVPLVYACALHNPFIVGIHHVFKVGVGQQSRGHIGSQCGDLGTENRPGLAGQLRTKIQKATSTAWIRRPRLCVTKGGGQKRRPEAYYRESSNGYTG